MSLELAGFVFTLLTFAVGVAYAAGKLNGKIDALEERLNEETARNKDVRHKELSRISATILEGDSDNQREFMEHYEELRDWLCRATPQQHWPKR